MLCQQRLLPKTINKQKYIYILLQLKQEKSLQGEGFVKSFG